MGEVSDRLSAALAGRYAIEREVGAGGMATVYLATDLKHHRKVAVKVLRPELAAVLGTERFLAEIRVTANLQHPHLLPLFDSGEAEGDLFYVMPFVAGESLRERLDRERQLPVEEAVRIAVAIANALDHAHRQGVVHRDLKPENILLQDGQPLVADFGVALAVSNAAGARITQTGLSLGTPAYMSPEQATGDLQLDPRSDIYALGAIAYEMLVGHPPHTATTTPSLLAKILTERPQNVCFARPSVAEHVGAAIEHALEKLPADRWATGKEFADALEGRLIAPAGYRQDRVSFASGVRRRSARWRTWSASVSAAALVAIAAVVALAGDGEAPFASAPPPSLFEVTFSDSTTVNLHNNSPNLALSPDASLLAFRGNKDGVEGLYVRPMNGMEARLLKAGAANDPHFSPDGQWVLFYDGAGGVWKVSSEGGSPVAVVDSADVWGFSWGERNQVAFTRRGGIWLTSADGGDPRLAASPDTTRGHLFYRWPEILPGGAAGLITVWKNGDGLENAELGLIRFDRGEVIELGIPGTSPRYASSGHIVFAREDGMLSAAAFSLRELRVTGPVVPLRDGGRVMPPGGADFALSPNGTLVYQTGEGTASELMVVDRRGNARPLPIEPRSYAHPRVSPDGRRIAVTGRRGAFSDIWTFEISSGTLSQLTTDGESHSPEWSPDSQRIANVSGSSSVLSLIQSRRWEGSGEDEPYPGGESPSYEISMGPPGSYVAVRRATPDRAGRMSWNIWIAPLDSPASSSLLIEHATNPAISPDGKWIAYRSGGDGPNEIFVRSITGPEMRRQVSSGGGIEPVWSPDGRELFYLASRMLISARLQLSPEVTVVGRDTLFSMVPFSGTAVSVSSSPRYDVFPSGNEFLIVRRLAAGGSRLLVRTNWFEELRRAAELAAPANDR